MKVKYIPFFTENMEQQARFFAEKLKFSISDKTSLLKNCACRLAHQQENDIWIALCEKKNNGLTRNVLILNTDDCIKDYHSLMADGVTFNSQPDYLPIGLCAEFTDPFDNRYILLEERDYNDDL